VGILVDNATWNIPIKRHHYVFLGILTQPLKTIPSTASQSAGGIVQAGVCLRKRRLLNSTLIGFVHTIVIGVILTTDLFCCISVYDHLSQFVDKLAKKENTKFEDNINNWVIQDHKDNFYIGIYVLIKEFIRWM
jgi:hypothetical protein